MIPDIRRSVAFRAIGAARLLLYVHPILEDLRAAVAAEQLDVAAYCARVLVLRCASIRGLRTCGEPEMRPDQVTFDPFEGLDEGEVRSALQLARGALTAASDIRERDIWLDRVEQYVNETEQSLGYEVSLTSIRTPGGLFPGLRLAREWLGILEDLELPLPIPKAWQISS